MNNESRQIYDTGHRYALNSRPTVITNMLFYFITVFCIYLEMIDEIVKYTSTVFSKIYRTAITIFMSYEYDDAKVNFIVCELQTMKYLCVCYLF